MRRDRGFGCVPGWVRGRRPCVVCAARHEAGILALRQMRALGRGAQLGSQDLAGSCSGDCRQGYHCDRACAVSEMSSRGCAT